MINCHIFEPTKGTFHKQVKTRVVKSVSGSKLCSGWICCGVPFPPGRQAGVIRNRPRRGTTPLFAVCTLVTTAVY